MTSQILFPFTIAELFEQKAAEFPSNIAVSHRGTDLTYAELFVSARRLAGVLQSHGVRPGTLVGIAGDRSIHYIVAMAGVVLAGGAYLPLDPALPAGRLRIILEDAAPVAILSSEAARGQFDTARCPVIGLEQQHWQALASAEDFEKPLLTPEDTAYVMYTSGSTGTPKGVIIPHRGVVHLVHSRYASFGPEASILQIANLCFDAATFEIWGSLLHGGRCVLMPMEQPSLQQIADTLVDERISSLFLTATLFAALTDCIPQAFRTVKEVITGGDVTPTASVRRALFFNPGLHVINGYGPTECTTFAATQRFQGADEVDEELTLEDAVAGTQLYVLREDLTTTKDDEEGELYVGGAGLAKGYLNRPELTTRAFLQSPFGRDGSRIYRTGDRCVRRADGRLVIRGRRDKQIKLRGFRIELGEIEAVLQNHPAVHSAAVKIAETAPGEKVLLAYAAPTTDSIAPDPIRDEQVFAELTKQWEQVYSKLLYRSLASADQAGHDPTLNSAGWKSSFDGRPISVSEMEEQVGQTVARILALAPKRILEIGCGTGMLLFRLAPHVESYVATDFSQAALDYVDRQLREMPWIQNVVLERKAAHELPTAPNGGFDVVVLNSVTEHFSSVAYLDDLVRRLTGIVSPDGFVFVGDNRNFTLLRHFHAMIQLMNSSNEDSAASLRMRAAADYAQEEQLTIDPYFFTRFAGEGYARVSVQLRRGRHHNEMTGYRYDVILQRGEPGHPNTAALRLDWNAEHNTLERICEFLKLKRPEQLVLTGIPNARLRGAGVLMDAVHGKLAFANVGSLRHAVSSAPKGIDPEQVWRAAEQIGYDVQLPPTRRCETGTYDAVFRRDGRELFNLAAERVEGAAPIPGNDPLLPWRSVQLANDLRSSLELNLPEYAVPAFITVLPHLPLTSNGKVDIAALPLPARLQNSPVQSAEGGTAIERQLRAIWENVLGVRNIGLEEQFFHLGGDSLKAVRVAEKVSTLIGRDTSPALLFDQPTLHAYAKLIEQVMSGQPCKERPGREQAGEPNTRGSKRRAAVTALAV